MIDENQIDEGENFGLMFDAAPAAAKLMPTEKADGDAGLMQAEFEAPEPKSLDPVEVPKLPIATSAPEVKKETFGQAWAKARAENLKNGTNKPFSWQGKSFTTDTKEEAAARKAAKSAPKAKAAPVPAPDGAGAAIKAADQAVTAKPAPVAKKPDPIAPPKEDRPSLYERTFLSETVNKVKDQMTGKVNNVKPADKRPALDSGKFVADKYK